MYEHQCRGRMSLVGSITVRPSNPCMRIFGIRGAVGLLLTILILKFLMSGPFHAFERFLVSSFTALERIPNAALVWKFDPSNLPFAPATNR